MGANPLEQIARLLGGQLVSSRTLTGGVSAEVTALQIATHDGIEDWVVRHHAPGPDWKQSTDAVAAARCEHGLMAALADAGLEVPRPGMFDGSGTVLPGPWFVLPLVDGAVNDPGVVARPGFDYEQERLAMADALFRLHAVPVETLPADVRDGLPRRTDPVAMLDALFAQDHPVLLDAGFDALKCAVDGRTAPFEGAVSILHGDFWSGNLLWKRGQLQAVLDWEDAAIGDPLADLAGAYVEMAWRSGEGSAEALLRACSAGRPVIDPFRWACWGAFIASAGVAWMGHWGLPAQQERHQRDVSGRLIAGFAGTIVEQLA